METFYSFVGHAYPILSVTVLIAAVVAVACIVGKLLKDNADEYKDWGPK